MINVCERCGTCREDKSINPKGPYAMCPECGHQHQFRHLPLFIVSGASGAGKSTVCRRLTGRLDEVVVLDTDILWRPEFDQPDTNYRDFFETWLRLAKNIGESGRPVVLFGAGFGVPNNVEPCIERRYFSEVHYLALVCSDEELAHRLRERPQWRKSGDDSFIEQQIEFNHWFIEHGDDVRPSIRILETTDISVEQTVRDVSHWIREIMT